MRPLLLGVCLPAFLLAPCRSDARENLVPTRIIAEGPRRVAGPGPGPSAPTHAVAPAPAPQLSDRALQMKTGLLQPSSPGASMR